MAVFDTVELICWLSSHDLELALVARLAFHLITVLVILSCGVSP